MPILRNATDADLPAITAIYAHHVAHGTGSFEIDPPSEAEMAQRRADVLSKNLPFLVAVDGTQVLGFAYCNWFRPRPAFRFCAEDSIYLAPQAQGRGLGRALLAELISRAQAAGMRRLLAVIGDSNNHGSIGLHRALGFQDAGVVKACGWKFGGWLDIVFMDLALGAGDQLAPPDAIGNVTR